MDAAPKLTQPKAPAAGAPGMPFDPSQLDPQMMAQAAQAVQRLPRNQLQRLQSIMQRAQAGKDVSREAAELEQILPPDFRAMMMQMMGGMMGQGQASAPDEMTPEKAREIVEAAARDGKLSEEQASSLLEGQPQKSGGLGRFFRKNSK